MDRIMGENGAFLERELASVNQPSNAIFVDIFDTSLIPKRKEKCEKKWKAWNKSDRRRNKEVNVTLAKLSVRKHSIFEMFFFSAAASSSHHFSSVSSHLYASNVTLGIPKEPDRVYLFTNMVMFGALLVVVCYFDQSCWQFLLWRKYSYRRNACSYPRFLLVFFVELMQ